MPFLFKKYVFTPNSPYHLLEKRTDHKQKLPTEITNNHTVVPEFILQVGFFDKELLVLSQHCYIVTTDLAHADAEIAYQFVVDVIN